MTPLTSDSAAQTQTSQGQMTVSLLLLAPEPGLKVFNKACSV